MDVPLFECRTCLIEITDFANYASLTDVGDSTRTIKEMIILCVPQMALTISCKDFVCGMCLESIKSCVKFIESCLEAEAKINKKCIKTVKKEPSNKSVMGIDAEIVIENASKMFDYIKEEHDYMIKIEVEDKPLCISDFHDENETINSVSSQVLGTSIPENVLTGEMPPISLENKASTSHEDQEIIYEEKKHECTICSRQFASVKALDIHSSRTHLPTKRNRRKPEYNCEFCQEAFYTVHKYKAHLKESHKDVEYRNCKPYYCEICNLILKSREKIIKHTIDKHGTVCTICLEGFPTKEALQIHQEAHPDKHVCNICEKGFRKRDSLRAHMATHQDYSCKCSECGQAFKSKSSLTQHTLMHQPDHKIMCDKCPKRYRNMVQLRKHQKVVHDKVKDFHCPECDKSFALKAYLDGHYTLMHIGEKPYQCEVCGKKFARSDYLKNHRIVHTGEKRTPRKKVYRTEPPRKRNPSGVKHKAKPMPCTICGKILTNIYRLKTHLNTHARIRKYPCEICGLKFMSYMARYKHKATHAVDPENKFVCPVCWKKMKTDEELQLHIADHNNRPKRHVCSVCGEAFSRLMLLENHTFENHTNLEEIKLKQKTLIEDPLIKVKELFG